MNKWVLLYVLFAPVFGIVMFLWFNRAAIKKRWWLFKHPQTVYLVKFFYPNKMFSEKYVSTRKDTFNFESGVYNIKQEAILRQNWRGWTKSDVIQVNESNCIDFEKYKLYYDKKFQDFPTNARIIGELHYVYDFPNPLIYPSKSDMVNISEVDSQGRVIVKPLRTAGEQDRVEKNSVLEQLITAEFKKVTLMIIIIICAIILLISIYQLALRLELIDTPLHAVCVNIAEKTVKG